MKKSVVVIILIILATAAQLQAKAVVQGQVISRAAGSPAPGLTVSLVHPDLGRSVPSTTNSCGMFFFSDIPIMGTPYFIEVYWGNQLIYRDTIIIDRSIISLGTLTF